MHFLSTYGSFSITKKELGILLILIVTNVALAAKQQRESQRVRGDEDIWVGQAGGKNGTIRILDNDKINVLNKSRTATYDDDEEVDERSPVDEKPVQEKAPKSASCHNGKKVGTCESNQKVKRYYYHSRRGCRRFQGCPNAGGNSYRSRHACQTECGSDSEEYYED